MVGCLMFCMAAPLDQHTPDLPHFHLLLLPLLSEREKEKEIKLVEHGSNVCAFTTSIVRCWVAGPSNKPHSHKYIPWSVGNRIILF